MSYKTVSLNSFTPVSTPTIVDNIEIDGYVDDRPVVIRKMRNGMMMPAIGTVLPLSMGTGIVSGYKDEMLVVDVVELDEDSPIVPADERVEEQLEELLKEYFHDIDDIEVGRVRVERIYE